jgi:hypothetical protein
MPREPSNFAMNVSGVNMTLARDALQIAVFSNADEWVAAVCERQETLTVSRSRQRADITAMFCD